MVVCPNCGTRNDAGARFCGECGADLRALGAAAPPPHPHPLPGAPSHPQAPGIPSGWGSPVPAQPEQEKGRRVWLWVSVGIIGAFLLCCCLPLLWASTVGEDEFIDMQTRVSDWLTEVAPTPTPRLNLTPTPEVNLTPTPAVNLTPTPAVNLTPTPMVNLADQI